MEPYPSWFHSLAFIWGRPGVLCRDTALGQVTACLRFFCGQWCRSAYGGEAWDWFQSCLSKTSDLPRRGWCLTSTKGAKSVFTDCVRDALKGRLWLLADLIAFLNPLSGALSDQNPWIMLALRGTTLLWALPCRSVLLAQLAGTVVGLPVMVPSPWSLLNWLPS